MMDFIRTTDVIWAGKPLIHMSETDSTNTLARGEALNGAAHGTVYWADRQRNGRGRLERKWESPAGLGVYMTMLLRPGIAAFHAPRLSIYAAVALCAAMEDLGVAVRIKWPNDIVSAGQKLCGILCETILEGQKIAACMVGMGINVGQTLTDFDPNHRDTATSLLLQGVAVERETVVQAVCRRMEAHYESGLQGGVMDLYAQYSATLGQRVRVIESTHTWEGQAISLQEDGALLVKDDAGKIQPVYAGDVSVRGIMGYA